MKKPAQGGLFHLYGGIYHLPRMAVHQSFQSRTRPPDLVGQRFEPRLATDVLAAEDKLRPPNSVLDLSEVLTDGKKAKGENPFKRPPLNTPDFPPGAVRYYERWLPTV
jgi:hypothetical protein